MFDLVADIHDHMVFIEVFLEPGVENNNWKFFLFPCGKSIDVSFCIGVSGFLRQTGGFRTESSSRSSTIENQQAVFVGG